MPFLFQFVIMKLPFILFNNLFEKIEIIYCKKIPGIFKKPIFTKIDWILGRISFFFSNFSHSIFIFSGKEKYSSNDIKIMYCGDENQFYYYSRRIFSDNFTTKKIGKYSILGINKLIKNIPNDIDLVVIMTDRFFTNLLAKKVNFVIPEWINMELDTSKPFSQIFNRFSSGALKDIKKIKKHGYTYEITNDTKKLKFFYDRMLLPFLLAKYKEETPLSYIEYLKMFIYRDNIELLLVKDGNKYVAGGLIERIKDKEVLPSMGILDGNTKYLKNYASSALFYFHILYAIENSIKIINYGNTRTFLNDGVFQYKRKWGMSINKSKYKFGVIGLRFCKNTIGVLNFLENNPFIYATDDKLKSFFYFNKKHPITLDDIKQICKSYYCPGIKELSIYSPKGFSDEIEENLSFEVSSKYKFQNEIKKSKFMNNEIKMCVVIPIS